MKWIRKYKLLIVAGILLALYFTGYSVDRSPRVKVNAETGILDLTGVRLDQDIVGLEGQWEFFWNRYVLPGETEVAGDRAFIQVPGSWNKFSGNPEQSGYGTATYRLQILIPQETRLAFFVPRVHTAYEMWVNGELVAGAGTVGENPEDSEPRYMPQIVLFESRAGVNEILINVSNFHHRSGGMLESVQLGSEENILRLQTGSLARELILFGSLVTIGFYHLALYIFRKKNRSSLYFGLFSVLVGIRTLLVGQRFFSFLFPDFSWEIAHKIQTLSYYLGVPLILMFFLSMYPGYFHGKVIRTAQIIGSVFGLLVLLTPARVFTPLNPVYQIWTVLTILYVMTGLVRLTARKEKGSWYVVFGALALLFSSLHDIVFLSIWLNDGDPASLRNLVRTGNLSSAGQFIFAFSISLLLARNFSDSLEQEEVLSGQLKEMNIHLDELVLQRTRELEESHMKIEQQKSELEVANSALEQLSNRDPLTGLWNRRKYACQAEAEWNRCARYQRPMSLLLLDIDFFKQFNDMYGHLAGDECLALIAGVLRSSLTRSSDLVARYGGEEFVVLLTDTEMDEAIRIAEMLRYRIRDRKIAHGKSEVSEYVTVSIGVASSVPENGSTYDTLFEMADRALYQAKYSGRDRVVFRGNRSGE